MVFKYNNRLTNYSRVNKKNQTEAEKFLWFRIRNRQLSNYKFRRQFPITKYILDFYCVEKRLAIELDGSQHRENKYDTKRDAVLESMGIHVMRFFDNEVFQNIEGLLEKVLLELNKRPHPNPLLKGEGKREFKTR